jgi:hypothetical protein
MPSGNGQQRPKHVMAILFVLIVNLLPLIVLVGFEVLTPVVMKSTIFWDITPPAFTLVSCSVYSTLTMEARCSSETLVDFQRTTRCYVPQDSS